MSVKAVTIVSIAPASTSWRRSSSESMPRTVPGPPGRAAPLVAASPADAVRSVLMDHRSCRLTGAMSMARPLDQLRRRGYGVPSDMPTTTDSLTVIEPATGQPLEERPRAGVEETDAAVARARAAYPSWRAMAPADRSRLLHRLADEL